MKPHVGRVSEGHKLPMCLGAQADEQHVFVEGLSDTQLSGAMTCEEAGLVQASVLTCAASES